MFSKILDPKIDGESKEHRKKINGIGKAKNIDKKNSSGGSLEIRHLTTDRLPIIGLSYIGSWEP